MDTNLRGNQYVYTRNGVYLTDAQRKSYEENGYVVFRNLVDGKLLDECKERFLTLCTNKKSDVKASYVMKDVHLKQSKVKGEFLIYKIQDFLRDDVLFKYVAYKPLVDIVDSIIGPNITACHSMLINKPPDSTADASRHPLHQDLHYFPFRPVNSIVATWTAMERVNAQNGCLFVVPGSHKGSLYKHGYPPNTTNKVYHGVIGLDHPPTVDLDMEKGDTVFFHPLLLHGSGPNLTKGFRKAISCHYTDSNSHFIDVKGTIQEDIEKELLDLLKRTKNLNITFEVYWKKKSRIVRGTPGNFQKITSRL